MATRKDKKAMLTGTDHECITGNSWNIRAVLKADTDIILMHVYGVVGLGIKGANFEMLLDIAAATDGGRRMVIAMGDYNIRAEELEASGTLKALGLTLVKADNSSMTCTSGKGSCIDSALVTSGFTEAIVDMKAVKVVPWGPRYGLRIRFKTDLKSLTIPEIVRPMPIEEAVKEFGKMGLTENNDEGTPRITWEEAKKITKKMVDKARKRQSQPEAQ